MSAKLVFYCLLSALITGVITFFVTYRVQHNPDYFPLCWQEMQAKYTIESITEPGTTMITKKVTGYIGFVTIGGKQQVYSCSVAGGKVERLTVTDNPILQVFAQGEKLED